MGGHLASEPPHTHTTATTATALMCYGGTIVDFIRLEIQQAFHVEAILVFLLFSFRYICVLSFMNRWDQVRHLAPTADMVVFKPQ